MGKIRKKPFMASPRISSPTLPKFRPAAPQKIESIETSAGLDREQLTPARGILTRIPALDWNPVLLAALTIAALFLTSQDWLFDQPGDIDSFKYVGIFLNFSRHLPEVEAEYKISRLPWILPGVLLYKFFTPEIANYVLQLTFTFAALVFLYLSIKTLFNKRVAFIVSLVFFSNHWYHGPSMWASGGWNYHNTASLSYYFISFYLFVFGAKRQNRTALFFAGAALACCFFTTIFMAPFVLGLLVFGVACFFPSGTSAGARAKRIAEIGAGAVMATVLLGVIRLLTKGPFFFFLTEWRYTLAVSKQNVFFVPIRQYLSTAYWLVYPLLTVSVIILLWSSYPLWCNQVLHRRKIEIGAAHVYYLAVVAWFVILSTHFRQTVFQFPQVVVPLAAPMMPALAGFLVATQNKRLLFHGFWLDVLLAGIAFLLPWGITLNDKRRFVILLTQFPAFVRNPLVVGLLLVISITAYQLAARHFRYSTIGTVTLLTIVNVVSMPYAAVLTRARDPGCCINRDAFEALVDANQFLTHVAPAPEDNQVVYSLEEHIPDSRGGDIFLSQLFNSIYASRLCPKVYDWGLRSKWSHPEYESFRRIAILSSLKTRETLIQELIAGAKRNGVPLTLLKQTEIRRGNIVLAISLMGQVEPYRSGE